MQGFRNQPTESEMRAPRNTPDQAASPAPEIEALPNESVAQDMTELLAKHAEVSDAYLRAKAEAENIRRRAEDEVAKARKFAVESFADSMLPVRDSLEAALASHAAKPDTPVEPGLKACRPRWANRLPPWSATR